MEKLLIVDDDRGALECLQDLLQTENRFIVTATNGKKALDCLKEAPRPRLILLDLSMPEMDGFEFLRRLRIDPAIARIPTIIVSGTAEAVPDGAVDLLGKPIDLDRLRALVGQYC
jgi:CheY-like chemotaxis protein